MQIHHSPQRHVNVMRGMYRDRLGGRGRAAFRVTGNVYQRNSTSRHHINDCLFVVNKKCGDVIFLPGDDAAYR